MKLRDMGGLAVLSITRALSAYEASEAPVISVDDTKAASEVSASVDKSSMGLDEKTVPQTVARKGSQAKNATGQSAKETSPSEAPGYRASYQTCLDAADSNPDVQDCIAYEFRYQDRRLNVAYRRLHQALSPKDWEALRIEQRSWLVDLDKECEVEERIKSGGTEDRLAINECMLDRRVQRANELEAQLRRYEH